MRVGISIEKSRVSSVVLNTSGAITENVQTRMSGGIRATVKDNISRLVEFRRHEVTHVFVGTDFVRHLLQYHTDYTPVGVMRLAGHNPDILMPCFNWSEDKKAEVLVGCETVNGGYDYDGLPITNVSVQEVLEATQRLIDKNAKCIVICGVFSPFYPDQEQFVCRLIKQHFQVDTLCCHELGIVGFMERENAGIVNAMLRKSFADKLNEIQGAFDELKMSCKLLFTQTNGVTLTKEQATLFPLQTIDAAMVNAFVGVSKLMQYPICCALYMDETNSFAMIVKDELIVSEATNPEVTHMDFQIQGVHAKLIGLNSVLSTNAFDTISVGPPCDVITAKTAFTLDRALRICAARIELDETTDLVLSYRAIKTAENLLIDFYKTVDNLGASGPLVLIGPAASLFPRHEGVVVSPFSAFTSAYGAAVRGFTNRLVKIIRLVQREKQLKELCNDVVQDLLDLGAYFPQIVFFDVQPFHYLPEDWVQVVIVVTGSVEEVYSPTAKASATIHDIVTSGIYGQIDTTIIFSEEREAVA